MSDLTKLDIVVMTTLVEADQAASRLTVLGGALDEELTDVSVSLALSYSLLLDCSIADMLPSGKVSTIIECLSDSADLLRNTARAQRSEVGNDYTLNPHSLAVILPHFFRAVNNMAKYLDRRITETVSSLFDPTREPTIIAAPTSFGTNLLFCEMVPKILGLTVMPDPKPEVFTSLSKLERTILLECRKFVAAAETSTPLGVMKAFESLVYTVNTAKRAEREKSRVN